MESKVDDNWFTIEQIDRDTFSISEYKHWEETHCYLLCGEKCAILIDTGLGVSNIRKIVDSLTKLPVMAITTHVHWDHIGGHKYFDNIAVYEAEKDWLSVRFPIPLQVVKNNLLSGDEVLRAYTQDGSIPLDGARISTARAIRENFMLGSMGRFAPVSGAFCVLMAAVLWLFWLFQKKLLEKRLRHIAVSIENFDDLESAAAMSPALAAAYEKMREKFTAQLEDYKKLNSYLSHEQKNVLALVRTEMELNGEEEYLRDLSLLTDGIDNVLTLSETEDTTRREAVAAVLVCAEVCDSYRKLHPNLQFTFDEDENCEIYAVRRWIQRAVSNLVDNAVKYGGEGEISLDVRAKNGSVILRVTDHGAGIPPEEQERIFEYQYRIGALKKDGYGIGLSLVHHVCTLCGGFAAVESVPGVETTFYLSFPQM